MANEIDALLGGGMTPNNTETAAMAAALRGQLNEGSALGMSTIGGVSDFGKSQATAAREGAREAGRLKKALEKEARDLSEKKAAEKRQQADWEAQQGVGLQRDKDYWQYQVDNPKAFNPYGRGSSGSGSSAYDGRHTGTMSKPEIKEFEAASADMASSIHAIDSYDPEYSRPKVWGKSATGIPFINKAENFIARNIPVLSDESEIKKQGWWSDFNMFTHSPRGIRYSVRRLPLQSRRLGMRLT